MMTLTDDNRLDLIQDYVHGRMAEGVKLEFENLLIGNADLKQEVRDWQQMANAHRAKNIYHFKKKLALIEGELKGEEAIKETKVINLKPRIQRAWLAAAACVVVAVGAFFFLANQHNEQKVVAEILKTYPTNTRAISSNTAPEFLYSTGQYAKAIEASNALLTSANSDSLRFELHRIILLSEIGLGQNEQALIGAESLYALTANGCKVDLIKALTFLNMDKKIECHNLLKQIPDDGNCFEEYQTAMKILKQIE